MAIKTYSLTTVARVCAFLGIAVPTGADLTLMEYIIGSATDYIEKCCNRRFKQTVYTQEVYSTEEAETLNLNNFPISTSAPFTLERRDSNINEDEWETVDSRYYHIDYSSGMITGAGGNIFIRSVDGYRVTYTAGYDFDNVTTFLGDTTASDIEFAAWLLISSIWNSGVGSGVAVGINAGIESERIGDYSVTYAKTVFFDEQLHGILSNYAVGGLGVGGLSGTGVIGPLTPIQS